MKHIKTTKDWEREKKIRKIITIIFILIILGLIIMAALGNLDAIRALWKTP